MTGSRYELPVTALVRDGLDGAARRRVVDLAGRTPLGTLAALLARSSVVVSNDTGVDGDWPPVEDVVTALDTRLVPC